MTRGTPRRIVLPLAAAAVAGTLSLHTGLSDFGERISRRTLMKLSGLGMAAIATGRWREAVGARAASSSDLASSLCVLSPEQTEGPYYIAREKVRSTITENRPGISLHLKLAVVDASSCKPIKGAAVDIWHCDGGGIYSGFEAASAGGPGGGGGPTDKHTFLRGIQFSDARGHVNFHTIYPGWYRGRTVHIHVKVHLHHDAVGHVVHTGQLYFNDSLTKAVYQRAEPYRSRAAARDTFNATDSIFQSGGAQSMLTMKANGHGGFMGTITLGVKRA
jgi:protocatechuate 3,4-dioxygenase beta subunit